MKVNNNKKEQSKEKSYEISIKEEWCKSCEICIEFCPRDVFEMDGFYPNPIREKMCTGCKLCEHICPDFAIKVEETNSQNDEN